MNSASPIVCCTPKNSILFVWLRRWKRSIKLSVIGDFTEGNENESPFYKLDKISSACLHTNRSDCGSHLERYADPSQRSYLFRYFDWREWQLDRFPRPSRHRASLHG